MILVFSLESHINATGENGHSHPFPNWGWLVEMSLSIKKTVQHVAVDRRELVRIHFVMPWDQYSLKFFAMPFGSRPLPINPGGLVLLSTKPPVDPGSFGLPPPCTPRGCWSVRPAAPVWRRWARHPRAKNPWQHRRHPRRFAAPRAKGRVFCRPTFFPLLFFVKPKKRPQGVFFSENDSWRVRDM